jgi:hypothetical protein
MRILAPCFSGINVGVAFRVRNWLWSSVTLDWSRATHQNQQVQTEFSIAWLES